VHERVERGYLSELIPLFDGKKIKGEAVIVLAGNNPKFSRMKNMA
jgi:16S rRNA C1402 (ribose-2'-O) methylase RsmI